MSTSHHGLHLIVDGQWISPTLGGTRAQAFPLVLPAREIRLVSPRFRPFDRDLSGDTRCLGFAVTGLRLIQAEGIVDFPLSSLDAGTGFHPPEHNEWRWTDGHALLPAGLCADRTGEALLVIEGFTAPARPGEPPWMLAPGPAVFLAGDSYPRDKHIEDHLLQGLAQFFAPEAVLHVAIEPAAEPPPDNTIPARLSRLARLLATQPTSAPPPVLFGRSSGARVATLYACTQPVAAVIALGYPFRAPGQPPEPARYAHLATIETPTLIIQGRSDPYGGAEISRCYDLAAAVTVDLIEATHELALTRSAWDAIARRILLFLGARIGR